MDYNEYYDEIYTELVEEFGEEITLSYHLQKEGQK
jgi:hypothetical protein